MAINSGYLKMKIARLTKQLTVIVAALLLANTVAAREIKIVGSSTVFPYVQAVAEEFARSGGTAPTVETTGTGGGFKIFCQGIGVRYPDITGASRAIVASEKARCRENGVSDITEILFGYDGLTIANSRLGLSINLSKLQLYLALAAKAPLNGQLVDNPYNNWRDIDPALPDIEIIVYGPPPTSGTRDAFVELVFHQVCQSDKIGFWQRAKAGLGAASFKQKYQLECTAMRQDGPFIEAGENDNLIVQRLKADTDAVGIFGYSFLFENLDGLQPVKIDGVAPDLDTIGDGSYGLSRPLYIYIKNAHRRVIAGMDGFITDFVSDDAIGPDGYLAERGLVVLPDAALKASQAVALAAKSM